MTDAIDRSPLRRILINAWPVLQTTAAATAAWIIATQFADHGDPFFAPISAVVALSAPTGERGLQAIRILSGVLLGIIVAELTVALIGGGYGRLAIACFVAMTIARVIGASRIVMIQAASSAILTVIAAGGEAGVDRLIDACIGGGTALVFSQLLFAPEPVALLRRAEQQTLTQIAAGLKLMVEAVESDSADMSIAALNKLRSVRENFSELARLVVATGNVVRRTAVWRSQMPLVTLER